MDRGEVRRRPAATGEPTGGRLSRFLQPKSAPPAVAQDQHQMIRTAQAGLGGPPSGSIRPLELVRLTPMTKLTSGRPEVMVGLIDGPVAMRHPDLAAENIHKVAGPLCSTAGWCSLGGAPGRTITRKTPRPPKRGHTFDHQVSPPSKTRPPGRLNIHKGGKKEWASD